MNFATTKERILYFIESVGISQKDFLTNTGIKRGFLDGDKLKATVNDLFIAKIIAEYPDLNIEWLITGKGEMTKTTAAKSYPEPNPEPLIASTPEAIYEVSNDPRSRNMSVYRLKTDYYSQDKQLIPLFDINASAGLSLLFSNQNTQIPLDHIMIPNAPKCDGAMYIRGDSMYPILKAGDIACYKIITSIDNIIFGEKYILDLDNGDDQYLTVKYVQKSEKGSKHIKLVSENKHHADRDIHISTIRAIAMVKISVRYDTLS